MNTLKKYTKEEVELKTLKCFLQNRGINFDSSLLDKNKTEPTDIRYNGTNYQVTIGDKVQIQRMRETTSKGKIFVEIRNLSSKNLFDLLLRGSLTKKLNRSETNTILLVEVSSTGNLTTAVFEEELFQWTNKNINLCHVWKEIYLVFNKKNVRLTWK